MPKTLPFEIIKEILEKSDKSTVIKFCKEKGWYEGCKAIFYKYFKKLDLIPPEKELVEIYLELYEADPSIQETKIQKPKLFKPEFISELLKKKSYKSIKFLQVQNYRSLLFNIKSNNDLEIIPIKLREDSPDYENVATEIYNKSLLKKVCPLKRGDVIRFPNSKMDENSGKLIYNGEKLVSLEYTYDSNGHIPSQFQAINEFPIKYFDESIDSELKLIYSDLTKVDNLTLKFTKSQDDREYKYSWFTFDFNNKKYALIAFDYSDNDSDQDRLLIEKIKKNRLYIYNINYLLYDIIEINKADENEKIFINQIMNKIGEENVFGLNMSE